MPRHRESLLSYAAICLALAIAPAPVVAAQEQPAPPDFARDVQPILKRRCYECHDARKATAELRLDVQARALAGGESGEPAIVPGSSEKSSVMARVTSSDESTRMPPEGAALSEHDIAVLKAWIDAGAVWPKELAEGAPDPTRHWAFQPPVRPSVPQVQNSAWARNDIDRFILARLEQEGLAPSAEADRVTLARRLSLDLVGLPPTPADIDAFVADTSPEAYERLVARLLDSPHYGERWGRHWLDAARYADSDGFEKDKSRQVWFYRDWVIGALNRDLPYDQFIVEQIAGDQLDAPTQDQIVATGFLRNSMINEEGGIDPEQFRMEAMFDRMDAIGKSVLGLTIGCAQCHDHKYDPLKQAEYYSLFAFLNNDHESNIAVYTPEEQMRQAEMFRGIAEIEAELRHSLPDWQERMAGWEASVRDNQPEWTVLLPSVEELATGGQKYYLQEDGSILAQGYAPAKHTTELTIRTDASQITGFRLELFTDPNLPLGGPGRSLQGTGALTEFKVSAAPAGDPSKSQAVKFVRASADIEIPEAPLAAIYDDREKVKRVIGPAAFAIDDDNKTAWGIDAGPGRTNQPRKAVFVAEAPISHEGGTVLSFQLAQNHGGWNSDDNQNHNLGRFRLSLTTAKDPVADPLPRAVREILAIPVAERTQRQMDAVFSYWRTTVPEWADANRRIEESWKTYPAGSSQLVLNSRANPRETHMLDRGDFLKPKDTVEPAVPGFLHALPADAPKSRLTFARWLVDRRSPTTARAIVNRVWQTYFGTGLVVTSEDLGVQATPPSHAELLDWLAVEFMESGWSLKKLHTLIVGSATYRQASTVSNDLLARDPANRWLARGPRFRVEGEVVRDIALAASGLLESKVGGPSVFPPLPEFMLQPPVSYGPKVWPTSEGGDRYRRGMYTFRYRSVPYPALAAFDVPNGDMACVRRVRSNTPVQSLTTLNEPVFVECARALARRTLAEAETSDEARLAHAFRLCVSRPPTADETKLLLEYYGRQKARIADGWLNAWELASGEKAEAPQVPDGASPTELAAWTAVSRVLLNLDETVTKE